MKYIVYDTETTGAQRNKGNPFDPRNRLCSLQYHCNGRTVVRNIEHSNHGPYAHYLEEFQDQMDSCDLLVGFNIKFDIHWGRRYGLNFSKVKVWDCQLYAFLRSNQRMKFPSMDNVARDLGVETKIDIIKTEYWEKGLDTDQVPWDILEEYGGWDVFPVNNNIFLRQWEEFQTLPKERQNLILLLMEDLLVLEDMEYNGNLYDAERSRKMGDELEEKIQNCDRYLRTFCPGVPISFNSDEQLSLFLYGGTLKVPYREKYTFVYKDPKKAPVEKERWVDKDYLLGQIFEPLPKTEKQKEGIFSTDKVTLKKLALKSEGFKKTILDVLLERSAFEQQKSTYCYGTPNLMEEMHWENSLVHGQLNQCVVVTGRLSCSKPNLQNQQADMQICFLSRFPLNANKRRRITA